jgi:hypothetical protein
MKAQDKPSPSLKNSISEAEGIAAKRIFSSLLLARKNISIYPPGHATTLDSINLFHGQLGDFLKTYGPLRFVIERDRIISKSGVITQGFPEEGSVHFALFQVGILWLEFLPGIEPQETQGILNIIVRYSTISGQADGDIVTAFWEAQFPHMEYEVAEFSWVEEEEEARDISGLIQEKAVGKARKNYRDDPNVKDTLDLNQADLELTQKEKSVLKEMIRREEGEDLTSFLDILLDCLLQHRDQETYKVILGVLSEEFKHTLIRKDFIDSFRILHGLRFVNEVCREETPWAGQILEDVFLRISLESKVPLIEIWNRLGSEDAGILGQIFKFFDPQAINIFVSLLTQSKSESLRQVLLDSILLLSSQDIRPLESILQQTDERGLENLVPLFIKLEGDQAMRYLMELARHPSAQVRHKAVKGIIRRDPARLKEIFDLIDTMEEDIRLLILQQLGQSRDKAVETLILAYLQKLTFNKKDIDYLQACFKTLGKCGSARSIPFLQETLFKGGFFPGSRIAVFRKGAATALGILNNPEAEAVLKKAGRSLNPSLRMVVKNFDRGLSTQNRRESAEGY